MENLDHLSHVDLDDEWLHMDKGSIIESLSVVRKNLSVSDYSVLETPQMGNFLHANLVKTKNDIIIQDKTMQKIIRLVSMFSEDIMTAMQRLRSKSTLLSDKAKFDGDYEPIIDFFIDMDQIDTNFVHLILDTLEAFKIFKLCIFVCNRYKLANRIGR